MPDPFRHYEGALVLDLPADPPALETLAADGAMFLSQLLFNRPRQRVQAGSIDWIPLRLRVNPSWYPTRQFHFVTPV
jgi:hypothetical protein